MAITGATRDIAWSADGRGGVRDTRTPSLVSFVGQTGAGKSTLIKLIIDLSVQGEENFATPVVGASGADVPTSEDVHLYLDPLSAKSDAPILLADCEGLEGGEREPIGARMRKMRRRSRSRDSRHNDRRARRPIPASTRELMWADSTKSRSREFAVTNLYPRLLYTFSDVIVFVLKNPRVVESVFERLVDWAAAALELSSNQPVLPHAIIAFNASENNIDAELWDVTKATEKILESLSNTVYHNSTFKKYAQFWRERNRIVETVEQLMLCYYSSVQIIRIPAEGRPKLIQQQILTLYDNVEWACSAARYRKAQLRMLLDAEELQSYLHFAFDHFADTLATPFDFVQASFSNSPIPLDFGGNILKLAINLMEVWEDRVDGRTIFEELSYMVASCIMFDAARHKNKGTVEQIFPQYLEHLDAALENFCDRHWPCEYIKPGGGARCVNVRSGHGTEKGHQLKDGTVFAVGGYVSRFSFETNHEEFRFNVYFRLQELLERLHGLTQNGKEEEEQTAAEMHRDQVMAYFYSHASRGGSADRFSSHTACFCCLFGSPEHALPCGHMLCTSCVKAYGHSRGPTVIEIHECPIESRMARRYQPWKIYLKPSTAGVRILTLDGGGIRGIVELEFLRLIEQAMGKNLPIQCFFDLIVGTSTGGLIALGLAAKNWSVDESIAHFEQLCEKAFTRRTGSEIFGIGWIIDNYNHSRYETGPLEEALINAYSEEQHLFGGKRPTESSGSSVKVAVTTTSATTGGAIVLANYNRHCAEKLSYHFQRPERPFAELKIWEAARATSAAPRIFRPFHHEASKQIYLDGAIYHNNPIAVAERERKLIWPSQRDALPDVVVSIGTSRSIHTNRAESSKFVSAPRRGIFSHGKGLLKVAKDHVLSSLDCEQTWNEFLSGLPTKNVDWSGFVRLNLELDDKVPALDDVKRMQWLRDSVRARMSNSPHIQNLAIRLVATSFYFQLAGPIVEHSSSHFTATGFIYCRLPQEAPEISALGKLFRDRSCADWDPYFWIKESSGSDSTQLVSISRDVIDRMIRVCNFKLRKIKIRLSNKLAATEIHLRLNDNDCYPISGFPRSLFQEDTPRAALQPPFATTSNRWAGRSHRRNWTAPDPSMRQLRPPVSSYTDTSRILGNASAQDVDRMSEALTNGPSPTAAAEEDEPLPTRSRGAAYLRDALRLVGRGRGGLTAPDGENRNQNTATGRAPSGVVGEVYELAANRSFPTNISTPYSTERMVGRVVDPVRWLAELEAPDPPSELEAPFKPLLETEGPRE